MDTICKRQISYDKFKNEIEHELKYSKDTSLKRRLAYGNYLNAPIEETNIFYESQQGSGILGLPKNIFLTAIQTPGLTHIWSVIKSVYNEIQDEFIYFRTLGNIKIVIRGSKEYYQYLATSKYLVTDSFFTSDFYKRPEQLLLHTGRGNSYCFKGYDKDIFVKPNEQYFIRHCLQANILLSPNQEETNKVFYNAYKLTPLFTGSIIEYGSISYGCYDMQNNLALKKILPFLKDKQKYNILIAPETYHCSKEELKNTAKYYLNLIRKLKQAQRSSDFNILLSVTRNAYSIFTEFPELMECIIPLHCDIRDIMKYVSCFVTDFNSVFCDFADAGIPVVFLKALYPKQLYRSISNSIDLNEVCSLILNKNYKTLSNVKNFVEYSIQDIWNSFYTKKQMKRKIPSCKKKKLIFLANFSKKNYFNTLDLLNMINYIDFALFDVTLICPFINKKDTFILNCINPHVRFLELNGGVPYSEEEYIQYSYLSKFLMNADNVLKTLSSDQPYMKLFQKNLLRILGDTNFDSAYYYGVLNNLDYLTFHSINAESKCLIRYDSPKEERDFFTATESRKFLFQNRCRIYGSFSKIFCISKELLSECKRIEPNIYECADYLPRFLQKSNILYTSEFRQEVNYKNSSYLIVDKELTTESITHLTLVPIPIQKNSSYLYIINDFSEEKFIPLLNTIQKCIKEKDSFQFVMVDNYNYIKEAKSYFPLLSVLQDHVLLIKNYIPTEDYISCFRGILTMEPENRSDFNVIFSVFSQSPLFTFKADGTLFKVPVNFTDPIEILREELKKSFTLT